ncbi:MAG: M15 family metallopeptidase [Gemmatimonadetes bacterium]|nr:M15 family metallopeptidase [Gemmatimonadota bacterium]
MRKSWILLLVLALGCVGSGEQGAGASGAASVTGAPDLRGTGWEGLLGEYESETQGAFILLEKYGLLHIHRDFVTGLFPDTGLSAGLRVLAHGEYESPLWGTSAVHKLSFEIDAQGRGVAAVVDGERYRRRWIEPQSGSAFRITPIRPVDELRRAALAAEPPVEEGEFGSTDLVEITSLDSTIHLDIRYATDNNFMGVRFYDEPRAFAQREVAEALVRVHRAAADSGYGLLIHDAYRPWYVTKMFWDATPEELRDFVADPASGSRHNRGAAIDLSLYDLTTGEPVEMVSGYDEFSPRAAADYPGGTSSQRRLRAMLRGLMGVEGFAVYQAEWWHFDFDGWDGWRIGNQTFDLIR